MLGVIDQLLVLMILRRVSEYLRLDHNRATTSGHLVCALMRLILQRLLKLSNHNLLYSIQSKLVELTVIVKWQTQKEKQFGNLI